MNAIYFWLLSSRQHILILFIVNLYEQLGYLSISSLFSVHTLEDMFQGKNGAAAIRLVDDTIIVSLSLSI